MPDFSAFEKSTQDRTSRAAQMRRDLLLPILDANGSFRSDISREELNTTFKTASQNSVYESAGEQAPMIMGIHARALKNFIEQHGGTLPSDELLASAHQAIENFMTLGRGKPALSGVFEDAGKEMSSTEGIIMRDRMVSLILPVLLNSITPNMVTLIPGQFNQSEFFRIKRIAGSKFGDLQKGDIIDYTYNGQYAVRSEEHTSELQSRSDRVCRLLLEKKQHLGRNVHTPVFLLSDIYYISQAWETLAFQIPPLRGLQFRQHGIDHVHVTSIKHAVCDTHRMDIGVFHDVFEFGVLVVRIDGHQYGPDLGGRKHERHPVGHVFRPYADFAALGHPDRQQPFCKNIDPFVELLVSKPQPAVRINHELMIRIFRYVFLKNAPDGIVDQFLFFHFLRNPTF